MLTPYRVDAHSCFKVFLQIRILHTFSLSRMCLDSFWCSHLTPGDSAQEQEIIENTSSCCVIGRSGTGKTTTMLFKMLGIERAWRQFPDMWNRPRQIFITQSRVLATKVEEYFSKLMLSVEAASYSPKELRKMTREMDKETSLVDLDDIDQWRSDLPESFSELTDRDFPLFITYDQVGTRHCFFLILNLSLL